MLGKKKREVPKSSL